jgi:hypothetical protein
MAAVSLAERYPALLERHTVSELENKLLDTVKAELRWFNWEPFVSIAQGPVRTLLECAKRGALEAIVVAVITWAEQRERAVFLMPIKGLRPSSDVVAPSLLWISGECPPESLNSLLSLPMLPETLMMFPPWLVGPKTGQQPLGVSDSLLGVVSGGWQIGLSELRRAVGRICVGMPDKQVGLRRNPDWSNVFELSERGTQALNAFGPMLPIVGNVREFGQAALEMFTDLLRPRVSKERERRFGIALEFLAAGWVLTGTQEFMNYFVALDALFGDKSGNIDAAAQSDICSRVHAIDARGRIKMLIRIRGEVLHGRCSSVERSQLFLNYYRQYHNHPTEDLRQIIRECLRTEERLAD